MQIRGMASFLGVVVALGAANLAAAENGISLEIVDKEPPAELADTVREQIAPKAYLLSNGNGLFYEFWFAPALTVSAIVDDTRDTLLNVEEVSVIGAVVVHQEEHYDFRDDPIDPGLYVLRFALQPKDGNHMGTAPFDTFALLLPYDKDAEVREFPDHDTMVDLASEDTVAQHPPIFSLQPLDEPSGDFPRLHWDEEEEWRFLYMKFPVRTPGGETAELPVGLVFEGMGEV